MKICIAQAEAIRGDVSENIKNHLDIIRQAAPFMPDMIVFPELSLTGYEPKLADALGTTPNDLIFEPFQEIADQKKMVISVGMPIRAQHGILISLLIFQPDKKEPKVYSKQRLHEDEMPYFVSHSDDKVVGAQNTSFLNLKDKKIALGICYETLQRDHFVRARENNADIFIASVAKPDRGLEKAYIHFPSMAKDFKMSIFMANSVGPCDNFISGGQSSLWNEKGELMRQLDAESEALLIYDDRDRSMQEVYLY